MDGQGWQQPFVMGHIGVIGQLLLSSILLLLGGLGTRVIQLVYYLVGLSLSLAWHFHLIDCRRTLHSTHTTHTIYSYFLLYLNIFSLALFTVAVAIRNCLGATASGTGTTTTRTERKWRYH